MMRIRSGFIGNLLGIGVRNQLTPWTTLTGYIQIWAYIESDDRNKAIRTTPTCDRATRSWRGRGALLRPAGRGP